MALFLVIMWRKMVRRRVICTLDRELFLLKYVLYPDFISDTSHGVIGSAFVNDIDVQEMV